MKQFTISFLLVMLLLAPCKIVAQEIILSTKWTAQSQFAGYYVAEKLGFYQDEGLDIRIEHPALSENSFSLLMKGQASVVVMNLSYAFLERMAGTPLVNIMQTSQRSSLMLVSRSPLPGIESLRNRKIGVWNYLNQKQLNHLANYYDLGEVEWIRFNGGINAFLSGAIDPCLVGSFNEYPQLAEYGMQTDSIHLLHLADHDYNLPEDGLYVTEEFYNKHPETVQKLVRASIRGWQWVCEHPEETLKIVMEEVRRNYIGTNIYHQRKILEEIIRLQVDQQSGKRTYQLSREGLERAAKILTPLSEGIHHIRYEDFVK